jgi:hypothetical protein
MAVLETEVRTYVVNVIDSYASAKPSHKIKSPLDNDSEFSIEGEATTRAAGLFKDFEQGGWRRISELPPGLN